MAQTFKRDRFTWLAYLLLAFYGYFLNVLGPVTPFLKSELHLSYAVSSLHFSAFAVGMLATGLGGHWVVERVGRWRALWIGALGMSVSAWLLAAGQTPVLTIGASFLMGLVGSLILTIIPAALSDQHGEGRAVALSEANVVASLVSTAAPLMVGWCAAYFSNWRLALMIAALLPMVLYVGLGRGTTLTAVSHPASSGPAAQGLPFLFWVYWLALGLAVSVEFCMISWSADYVETVLGLPKAQAAQAVSLFLGGMIFGRLAGSRLVQRFKTSQVVTASIFVAAAGFVAFWQAKLAIVGLSGLFVTGLGVASLYPLILSLAIGAAHSRAVEASARATLASGLAILTLPLVLGRLADAVGIGPAYGIVVVLLGGVFVVIQGAGVFRQKSLLRPAD